MTACPFPNARMQRRWAAYLRIAKPARPGVQDFMRWITEQHSRFLARFPTTKRRIETSDRDDFERYLEAQQ